MEPHNRFPAPPGYSEPPVWTGKGFLIGRELLPILSYDVGPVAWSDELTGIHEETAGDDHYIDRASREHAADQLERWLGKQQGRITEGRIMDIGCSSGFLIRLLGQRFPGLEVIGADCVRGPLERLSRTIEGVPLLQFDLLTCPLPGQSFEALVLLNVLEHVDNDREALRQTYRILKPGGIAVIEVPAGPGLYDVYDRQLLHFRRYRMSDLLDRVRETGFEILDRSHLGFFLYPGFWAVKKRNRKYLNACPEVQREVVRRNIISSGHSSVMHAIMRAESRLRQWIFYPFGIRCLVTCRRPLT